MKVTVILLALAAITSATLSGGKQVPWPLGVKIEMVGNSEMNVTFSNDGKDDIRVLKAGSILDSADVDKVKVTANGRVIPFQGVRLRLAVSSLEESDFQRIAAGKSVSVTFDTAKTHDLSNGGKFRFQAVGAFLFAGEQGKSLVGSIPYSSTVIDAEVDGGKAAAVKKAFHERRTKLQSTCSGQRLAVTQMALRNCNALANKAKKAAVSGPVEKMVEYFKKGDLLTRTTVADVFGKVAEECGSTDSGVADYHCQDYYSNCGKRVLAYTVTSRNVMVFCPLYFNNLTALTDKCHKQDQATTNIHEVTHLYAIKGTSDYGGYGYDFIRSLSPEQNINHADTYALFANAVHLNC